MIQLDLVLNGPHFYNNFYNWLLSAILFCKQITYIRNNVQLDLTFKAFNIYL